MCCCCTVIQPACQARSQQVAAGSRSKLWGNQQQHRAGGSTRDWLVQVSKVALWQQPMPHYARPAFKHMSAWCASYAYVCTACVGGVQQPHLQCRVVGGKVLEPKQITAHHSRTSSSKVSSPSTHNKQQLPRKGPPPAGLHDGRHWGCGWRLHVCLNSCTCCTAAAPRGCAMRLFQKLCLPTSPGDCGQQAPVCTKGCTQQQADHVQVAQGCVCTGQGCCCQGDGGDGQEHGAGCAARVEVLLRHITHQQAACQHNTSETHNRSGLTPPTLRRLNGCDATATGTAGPCTGKLSSMHMLMHSRQASQIHHQVCLLKPMRL